MALGDIFSDIGSMPVDTGGGTIYTGAPGLPDSGGGGYSTGSGYDFNVDNLIKLAEAGVGIYGQVKNIDHGAYAQYGPTQQAQLPEPQQPPVEPLPAQTSSFDWSQLTNFSTPYPYVIGVVGLVAIAAMTRGRSSSRSR